VYKYLNYSEKPTTRSTNPKYSKIKAFKIKIILGELPTYSILYKRNPQKYLSPLCFRCSQAEETTHHLLTCAKNTICIEQLIANITKSILQKYRANNPENTRIIREVINKQLSANSSTQPTLGLISNNEAKEINQITSQYKGPHNLACHILHKAAKEIYKQIWITRCQSLEVQRTKNSLQSNNSSKSTPKDNSTSKKDNTTASQLVKNKAIKKIDIWAPLFISQNTSSSIIGKIII
jgi:hypothetical protein